MTSKFNNMSMSFKWQLFGKEGDESFLGTSPEVVEKLPAVAYAVPTDLVKQLRSLNEPEEPKKKKNKKRPLHKSILADVRDKFIAAGGNDGRYREKVL
jgi:hypothetical protein